MCSRCSTAREVNTGCSKARSTGWLAAPSGGGLNLDSVPLAQIGQALRSHDSVGCRVQTPSRNSASHASRRPAHEPPGVRRSTAPVAPRGTAKHNKGSGRRSRRRGRTRPAGVRVGRCRRGTGGWSRTGSQEAPPVPAGGHAGSSWTNSSRSSRSFPSSCRRRRDEGRGLDRRTGSADPVLRRA